MKYLEDKLETKTLIKVPTITQFNDNKNELNQPLLKLVVIDTETTGLNHEKDEIIELGYTIIEFDREGNLYDVVERFDQFQEPSNKISDEIFAVTGISNEDVAGKSIDWEAVENSFNEHDVVLFIAHNAGFDRKFLEHKSEIFKNVLWGCSQSMVNYLDLFGSSKNNQEFLVWKVCDSFYDAHRAIDDVNALSFLISHKDENDKTILKHILEAVKQPDFIVQAKNAPFDDKDALKNMGCQWNATKKVWQIKTTKDNVESVKSMIKKASPRCTPNVFETKIADRFSVRAE